MHGDAKEEQKAFGEENASQFMFTPTGNFNISIAFDIGVNY